jgi:chemotaxis protein methyltransferase CheR
MSMMREFTFTDEDFEHIAQLVSGLTGIVLVDHKKDMVYGRLSRRLRDLHLQHFKDYLAFLESADGEQEIREFVNALTTNLTSFFRESHHFEHLDQLIKHLVAQGRSPQKLRIWSSACSSGQEPYSIAMIVWANRALLQGWDVKILATDIDSNMVRTASEGRYVIADLEKIPESYHATIERKGDFIQMRPELQQMISFKELNLLGPWPMKGPFDVIFCRNVVIYFDKPTQVTLFERFAALSAENGTLYIGHSENISGFSTEYHLIDRTTYQKGAGS